MQTVSPDVPPEPVQPDLCGCGPRSGDLKNARGYPQTGVGGGHFDTGHPLGSFASLLRREPCAIGRVARVLVDVIDLVACLIGEGRGGAQMRQEISVRGEDVELVLGLFLVLDV